MAVAPARVTLQDLGTSLLFLVDDDGPSIPATELERFYRLDEGPPSDRTKCPMPCLRETQTLVGITLIHELDECLGHLLCPPPGAPPHHHRSVSGESAGLSNKLVRNHDMKTIGFACEAVGAPLAPFTFERRALRRNDVAMEILYSGV